MKKYLNNFFSLKKTELKKSKNLISSLAPKVLTKKEDIEKIQPYLDKLYETIDTKGISNIALTGGYGSGKSTIIGTFKELNSQYEYLKISLASFNKKKSDAKLTLSEKKSQKEELERLLEVSILQQIFYHVKPTEIPKSRFKRIINIPDWKIWGISIGFILWCLSSILLIKYNYLDKINPDNWNSIDDFDWLALIIFLIAFVGLGLFSKLVIKLFSNSKINKVNIKGELELGENVNKSVFNEHLEEILYFFERTKYNVVIIEDLDRFDSTDIFTKLREINILLNNSKLINREINFVYAVGDDLFEDKKERVKFFEYIIPVIPFINSSNADDQLKTLIKEAGLDESIFSKEFISDVITFIDDIDMRLLINIFHEFVIYRKTLKPEFIKKNDELFSMIIYKNIDPKDFTKLNNKDGKLYKLINDKKVYKDKMISVIDLKVDEKNKEIESIKSENINNIAELKPIYILKILEKITNATELYIKDRRVQFKDLMSDDFFNEIINTSNIRFYQNGSGAYNSNVSFEEIENEVNPNLSYKKRSELIRNKHNNQIELLKKEVENLKVKKSLIENWDLKQIFNEVNIDEYLKDFLNNGLLRNFIINGYINENYNDYISLFHEVSITKEDFTFERNVKGGYSTDFNYKLSDKVENLIEKIDQRYFQRETILNFDLLDYLGNNYNQYSNKYDSIIHLLSNGKEKSLQFIDEYIKNEERPLVIFMEKLVENWKGFWDYIYLKSSHTEDIENKYLELIIRFSNVETILKNQNNNTIRDAIEEKANFLSLIKNTEHLDYFGKITRLLKELNVEFDKLDNPSEETKKQFEYVYTNNHYKINKHNLLQMSLIFGKGITAAEFKRSNYSSILESECKPMIKYINSNITTYIEDVYLRLEENIFEDESSLIELLNINSENLTNKIKAKIIQKVETKISELMKINQIEIKTQLLINNKVTPIWNNVIDYYSVSENTISESLIGFLEFENVNSELSKIKLVKENETFEGSILLCNDIADETYVKLLNSIYFRYNKLAFKNLNKVKVIGLTNKILSTTKSNYDLLREHFPNNHMTLIERDFKKFIDNISDFEMVEDDIILLLKSEKISIDNKLTYISKLEQKVILDSKEISKAVGNIILQKNTKVELQFSTIASLVNNVASSENKVKLVNLYFSDLDSTNIINLLKNISGYDKLFMKGKPTYTKSGYNDMLFKKLISKNLIKKYYDDFWSDSKFRVTTNY